MEVTAVYPTEVRYMVDMGHTVVMEAMVVLAAMAVWEATVDWEAMAVWEATACTAPQCTVIKMMQKGDSYSLLKSDREAHLQT